MVEVFKTNVQEACTSLLILQKLREQFPGSCVNFDLEDCDRILRVEDSSVCSTAIIALLQALGYCCEVLPENEGAASPIIFPLT